MLAQERLELVGWRFVAVPPDSRFFWEWTIVVARDGLADRPFKRPQRHDALGQALQYAIMSEPTLGGVAAE